MRFGKILSQVFPKAVSPHNLQPASRSTGIYPYETYVIPEAAFAPSSITYTDELKENAIQLINSTTDNQNDSDTNSNDSDKPSSYFTDGVQERHELIEEKKKDQNVKVQNLSDFVPSPNTKTPSVKRCKALNSAAQVPVKDLFSPFTSGYINTNKDKKKSTPNLFSASTSGKDIKKKASAILIDAFESRRAIGERTTLGRSFGPMFAPFQSFGALFSRPVENVCDRSAYYVFTERRL
ncbi:hypothetical protein Trydic_g13586 [Trypoxylus dichotomus]